MISVQWDTTSTEGWQGVKCDENNKRIFHGRA